MNDILQYLLKWSIALAVVFLFYRIALRPLTFYQWNRRYLIMYSLVAFLIPFINLSTYVQPQQLQQSALVQFIPAISIQANAAGAMEESNTLNILLIAGLVILAGSLLLSIRLAIQWYSLHRIRRQAVRVYHPEATVYHVDENVIPFSFGNAIYVNTSLHSEKELNDIILHEFVHVRQKHSFDIIWSEVLCILNWYNPFAWCIRHAIRQNLEFIADQAVLQHGLDKKTYQYHLLKVIGSPQYSIANNFNFSSLKKRIAMMNRLKSARVHLVKFLFVLPLLAVLLVAFRQNDGWYQGFQEIKSDGSQNISSDTDKPRRIDIEVRIVHLKEFYQMNPSVKEVAWSADDEIVIYLRNGQREAYRLKDDEEMKKYLSLYKAVPSVIAKSIIPPPPPGKVKPPLPPAPPKEVPVVISEPNIELPEGVTSVETENKVVIVTRKDGTVEKYDLKKPEEKAAIEKKYGEVIIIDEVMVNPPSKPGPPTKAVTAKPVIDMIETPVKVEVIEKPKSTQPKIKTTPVQPVIHLKADESGPASVKVIHDNDKEQVLYADKIIVHAGVPEWNISPKEKARPVYYLNGKRATQQDPNKIAAIEAVSHMEIISAAEVIKAQGESKYNAIINIITKENTHNKSAYLAKESQETVEESKITSKIINTLILDEDNPIDIKVEGVPEERVEVVMSGGQVIRKDGRYFARPNTTGNVEIRIYKKEEGKERKLINKRIFRVVQHKTPTT